MAGSIKLFQFAQKIHQAVGIYPSDSSRKKCSINPRNAIVFFFVGQFALSIFGFLGFEANGLFDYGFGYYLALCMVNTLIIFSLLIWKSKNTLKFIENCEEFIKTKSTYHASHAQYHRTHPANTIKTIAIELFSGAQSTIAYRESIEKIERFNKYLCIAVYGSITFCVFIPMAYSVVLYYIYDMGEGSFYLVWPCWFVYL